MHGRTEKGVGPVRRVDLDETGRHAWLAELRGWDEESVGGVGTWDAICLLDRLLVGRPGTGVASGGALDLSPSERDRLLATVFEMNFGSRIELSDHCESCGARFSGDFGMGALMAHALGSPDAANGTRSLPDGRRLRAPTGADEIAIAGLAAEEAAAVLARRCLVDGGEISPSEVEIACELLQGAAPMVELELSATCPECQKASALHFDLQRFVLEAIVAEEEMRALEVSSIARAYRWSRREILDLRRSQRKRHAHWLEDARRDSEQRL